MGKTSRKIIYGLITAILWLTPNLAFAGLNTAMTVKNPDPYSDNKTWFRYNLAPGRTIDDMIVLTNLGKTEQNLSIYPADATTNESGSFVLKHENDIQKDIGNWVQLAEKKVILQPGERKEIPFKLNIPTSATPGSYAGGIVMEEYTGTNDQKNCATQENCNAIKVKTRIGNRLYLTIDGATNPRIEWKNFSYDYDSSGNVLFNFKFINEGNVAFEPKANIEIYNFYGEHVAHLEKPLGESMANTIIEPKVSWKPSSSLGYFTAKANIIYEQKYQPVSTNLKGSAFFDSKEIKILLVPWMLVLITLSMIGLGSTFFVLRKKQTAKLLRICSIYTVQENENILNLAHLYKVNWQSLAKINNLKAPYILQTGQKIKLPCRADEVSEPNSHE